MARIEGGKFEDGFSVGAAGYLFNQLGHNGPDPYLRHLQAVDQEIKEFTQKGFIIIGTEVGAQNPNVPFGRVYDIVVQDPSTGLIYGVEVKSTIVGLFRLNRRQVGFDVATVRGGTTLVTDGMPVDGVMYRGVSFGGQLSELWQAGELLHQLNRSAIQYGWSQRALVPTGQ